MRLMTQREAQVMSKSVLAVAAVIWLSIVYIGAAALSEHIADTFDDYANELASK